MAQEIPISGLGLGVPKGTDVTPAVDTTDTTQAPTGSTKKYTRSSEFNYYFTAAGLRTLPSARLATTAALTATYANGTLGVGATLTNAGTQTALILDSLAGVVNDLVLVKNQAAPAQNGLYSIANIGSNSTDWIMTRSLSYDQAAEIMLGDVFLVTSGSVNGGLAYQQTASGPFTVGTTGITFALLDITSGGVAGPGSSTDNALPRWDGTDGSLLQDSSAILDDTGNLTGILSLNNAGEILIANDLVSDVSTVDGIGQVVMACDRGVITSASRAAIIAAQGCTISSSGEELFMAACASSSITGGNFGFCFGSNSIISGNYNFAGILAVQSGTIDGSSNSLIASGGSHLIENSGFAAIVSGSSNSILGSSLQCVILNGYANVINANSNGVILNGTSHYLSSSTNSTITHGTSCNANTASGSLIGGSYATAAHAGVIVFTDSLQSGDFSSDVSDSWKSFFTNGYQLLGGGTVFSTPVQTITTSSVLTAAQWANRILFNSGSAITITLPQQSTETTAAGVWFEYENIGAGDVTFVKEGAETLTGNTLCATGGSGKFLRDTTTDWFNSGGTSVFTSTVTLFVQTVGNVTYNLAKMPGAGTFTSLHSICRSGTCTATFAIAGSNITATPNSVSTTNQDQSATAANTFTTGQYLQVTISANSTCLDMTLGADYTYRVNI